MAIGIEAWLLAGGGLAAASVSGILAWRGRPRLPSLCLAAYLAFLSWFILTPLLLALGARSPGGAQALASVLGNAALAAFAVTYGRPTLDARVRWRLLWALIPATFVLLAMATWPALFFTPDFTATPLARHHARLLHNYAAFLGILTLGGRLLKADGDALRRSLSFPLLAFIGFATNHVFADTASLLGAADSFGSGAPPVLGVSLLNLGALAVLFARGAPRIAAGDRLLRGLLLATIAFALVASLQLAFRGSALPLHQMLDSIVVAVLAYGVARGSMLDVDLQIKWTIRRGTLVGAFAAAFFVAAAIAEQYLERYGAVAGGLAAGLMLFALRPLERAADRLADGALPRVKDADAYRTVRRRELYRAAYESAMQDGAVSEKERDVLATLAQELGLGPADARAIERDGPRPAGE